jgi:hypothetical protein
MNEHASTASAITDEQLVKLAADHLSAFCDGGYAWFENEVGFARAVLALVAPTAQPTGQEPFAYYIYIAAEQRGELVHDLEDAMDDLTNCECEITELFDHPAAAVEPSQPAPCDPANCDWYGTGNDCETCRTPAPADNK